ncbi:MAG TPA: carbohydrate kinase family protein [Patescibacteria group bacterium]
MPQVTTIGSALVDVFIRSSQFAVDAEGSLTAKANGGKLAVESFALKTGGGASNTAVGFARMGFDTNIVSETGKDELAVLIVNDLHQENVTTSWLVQEKKEETGGSVILIDSDTGDRTVLTHRGASSRLDPEDLPSELLSSHLIHISSVSGQLATLQKIFTSRQQQQSPVLLSWNPGVADIVMVVDGRLAVGPVDYLFVNKEEWEMLATKHAELLAACATIIITNSTHGGEVYQHGQSVLQYQAEVVDATDTTGAGDAFAVGFLSAQLRSKSLADAIDWGKKNSASVVQHIGAKEGLLRISNF